MVVNNIMIIVSHNSQKSHRALKLTTIHVNSNQAT